MVRIFVVVNMWSRLCLLNFAENASREAFVLQRLQRRMSSGFAGENLGCIVKENAGEEFCETSPALILFVFKNPFEQFFVFHTARSNCKPHANYFVNTRINPDTVDFKKSEHDVHTNSLISVNKCVI